MAGTIECSIEILWKIFMSHGRVFADFCPRKRGWDRRRFVFVRFIDVKDTSDLGATLNRIWIGTFKLKANVAKGLFRRGGEVNRDTAVYKKL
ncbi:hypothetical protein Ancab_019605 [Ancistrocladus abbreviatus]